MTVLSTNPDYHNNEQQTTNQWVDKVFAADGLACLLKPELLDLEDEIGEGAFGKVYKGSLCMLTACIPKSEFALCTSR